MAKTPTFKEFLKESLQNPEFKEAYDALAPEFELIAELICARKRVTLKSKKSSRKPKKKMAS